MPHSSAAEWDRDGMGLADVVPGAVHRLAALDFRVDGAVHNRHFLDE